MLRYIHNVYYAVTEPFANLVLFSSTSNSKVKTKLIQSLPQLTNNFYKNLFNFYKKGLLLKSSDIYKNFELILGFSKACYWLLMSIYYSLYYILYIT